MRLAPLAFLALASCVTATPRDEFATYRSARLGHDTAERVAAASEYLAEFPNGALRNEALRDLAREEPAFWSVNNDSSDGIARYLAVYPHGAHASRAREQREAFRTGADAARVARREAETRRRYEAMLRSRSETYRFTRHWLVQLGSLAAWGQPLDALTAANPSLEREFAEAPPSCDAAGCFVQEAISCPRTVYSTSVAHLDLAAGVRLRERTVAAAEIRFGARAFGAWRACVVGDQTLDESARAWAYAQMSGLVASVFPDARVDAAAVTNPSSATEKTWMRVHVGCPNVSGTPIPREPPSTSRRSEPIDESTAAPTTCLAIEIFAGPNPADGGGIRITPVAP